MRYKILTVDDAKTVRLIVRKAFRTFDCEIIEAANGVEGLATAAKTKPDLVLLDITMPVMDGIEMLTQIKVDPQLRSIPVIMLTAEGGRDHVMKIAKLGVRDYIVKPFKEDTLIEKVGRVIDLQPMAQGADRQRSTQDPADILVVEDKPTIVQQIADGLKHTPWKIHGVATQGEGLDFCSRLVPQLILISLSLPADSAFALFRAFRTNLKTKFTPIFGLAVKTDISVQNHAQEVGITTVITKPIDLAELEARMIKAMNLDTSSRYFKSEAEFLTMSLPENCTPQVLAEFDQYLRPKLADAVDAGLNKVVIDVHSIRSLHTSALKLLMQSTQACRELGMSYALVGNAQIAVECKSLEETKFWTLHETIEAAKSQLGGTSSSTAPAQLVGA